MIIALASRSGSALMRGAEPTTSNLSLDASNDVIPSRKRRTPATTNTEYILTPLCQTLFLNPTAGPRRRSLGEASSNVARERRWTAHQSLPLRRDEGNPDL